MILKRDIINRIPFHRNDLLPIILNPEKPHKPPHRDRHEFRDGSVNVRNGSEVLLKSIIDGIPIRRVGWNIRVLDPEFIAILTVRQG